MSMGVTQRISTPGYAQSNGEAESNVKKLKRLIQKCGGARNEAFNEGLMELRNTPLAGGKSPAEIVYGHPMRTRVPTHWTAFKTEWLKSMAEHEEKAAEIATKRAENYDKSAKTLPPLERGDEVLIQDMKSKRWDKAGTIVGIGRSRDYRIKTTCGRVTWRNRWFLRPLKRDPTPEEGEKKMIGVPDESTKNNGQEQPELRRTKRVRFQTDRYKAETPSPKKKRY